MYDANGGELQARFDFFAPVQLPTPPGYPLLWGVPMLIRGVDELREFSFMVGDHMKRTFTSETLPEFLRDRLSVLLPYCYTVRDQDLEIRGSVPTFFPVYTPGHYPKAFREIGWFAGVGPEGDYYSVSMTWTELMTLRGETWEEWETHDT